MSCPLPPLSKREFSKSPPLLAFRLNALYRGRSVRVVLLGPAIVLLVFLFLLVLAVETEPTLGEDSHPDYQYLARTHSFLRETVRTVRSQGGLRRVELNAEDLTAASNFLLSRKKLHGRARCSIRGGRLELAASIRLPLEVLPLYLNLRIVADDGAPQVRLRRIKLGDLSIPSPLVGWLAYGIARYSPLSRYSIISDHLVQETRIQNGQLRLVLDWNRDVLARAEGLVTDLADKERLLAYHQKLAEVVGQPQLRRFVRLSSLMQPLFALARERSLPDNDPIAENRALILLLGAYVNGKDITAALPAVPPPAPLASRDVLLSRRIDTAQHFMGSAALTLAGHGALVDVFGLAKEMNDTHNGSGFSFIDLAADRAGAAFGKFAVRSGENARRVQEVLGQNSDESIFMPSTKDLPENLDSVDFGERFGDIESRRFQDLKARIDERIMACGLYQP